MEITSYQQHVKTLDGEWILAKPKVDRKTLTEVCPVCDGKWKLWYLDEAGHDKIAHCSWCRNGKVDFIDYVKLKSGKAPKRWIQP